MMLPDVNTELMITYWSYSKKNSAAFSPQKKYTDRSTAVAGKVHAIFGSKEGSRDQHNGSTRPLFSVF
jgi:hypothetical protein